MTSLYIIAAGLGSRMGNISVPKALMPLHNGKTNILNSVEKALPHFEKIFIIGNVNAKKPWLDFFETLPTEWKEKVDIYLIESGLGDGHAVLNGLERVEEVHEDPSDEIVILWGDAYIAEDEIFSEILRYDLNSSGCAPVVLEKNPYVTFLVDQNLHVTSADFSKRGEQHATGFHDQSIFKFNKKLLMTFLRKLHNAYWKNGRYVTDTGEMTFLYVMHFLYNEGYGISAYPTEYPVQGYNTQDEYKEIIKCLKL